MKPLEIDFQSRDLVLKWDARKEDRVKHGKIGNLWIGPYMISIVKGNNTFVLAELDGISCC